MKIITNIYFFVSGMFWNTFSKLFLEVSYWKNCGVFFKGKGSIASLRIIHFLVVFKPII